MTAALFAADIDENKLMDVTAAVKAARDTGQASGLPLKVYVMANCVLNGLENFLEFHALRGGIDVQVTIGSYNIFHQDLISPASALHATVPQLLVLGLVWDTLFPEEDLSTELMVNRMEELFSLAADHTQAAIAVNSFVAPLIDYDRAPRDGTLAGRVSAVNEWIAGFVEAHRSRFFLCDWNRYIQRHGREASLDSRYWYMAKAPFKPAFLSDYAADLAKIGRALRGLNKKVLVLDCDGTLWGGILGEDGPEGIALHGSDYPGNVFHAVQRQIRELTRRGVLLALCSKNNEADVIQILDSHPHGLLKPTDFAAIKVNWENKADNIAQVAHDLNLGLDGFVFVDDNPFEIEMVRQHLPTVETLLVPKNLYQYPDTLARTIDRYFYPANQTDEDEGRTRLYQAKRQSDLVKTHFTNTDDYLRSLDITIDIHDMTPTEVARVAQLTQKTNQFNVRKEVFGEAELASALGSDQRAVFVGVVADRFSALGLTNVCLVERDGDAADITSFLMSCRVFERKLEYVFLDDIIGTLQHRWQTVRVRATFVPNAKNKVAENFFDTFGFHLDRLEEGRRHYMLDVADYRPTLFDYIRKI